MKKSRAPLKKILAGTLAGVMLAAAMPFAALAEAAQPAASDRENATLDFSGGTYMTLSNEEMQQLLDAGADVASLTPEKVREVLGEEAGTGSDETVPAEVVEAALAQGEATQTPTAVPQEPEAPEVPAPAAEEDPAPEENTEPVQQPTEEPTAAPTEAPAAAATPAPTGSPADPVGGLPLIEAPETVPTLEVSYVITDADGSTRVVTESELAALLEKGELTEAQLAALYGTATAETAMRAPQNAFAEAQFETTIDPHEVEIVAPYEYKVTVLDGDKKDGVVAGAKVVLDVKNTTGKTRRIEKTTGADGKAVFGADNTTETMEGAWTGTLTVTKDGLCSYLDAFSVFRGGSGQDAVLTKDEGKLYLAGLGLQTSELRVGKDTLYTTDKDDSDKTLAAYLSAPEDAERTVQLLAVSGSQTTTLGEKKVSLKKGTPTRVEFTDKWAQKLAPGTTLSLKVVEEKDAAYEIKNLKVEKATFSQPATPTPDAQPVSSFKTEPIDSGAPAVGGLSISFDLPHMKCTTFTTISGETALGVNVKVDEFKDDAWKKVTAKEQTSYINALYDTWQETVQKYVAGSQRMPDSTKIGEFTALGHLEMQVNAMGVMKGNYTRKTGRLDVSGTIMMQMSGKMGYTQKFVVFVVPVSVGFDITGRLAGEIHFGLSYKMVGQPEPISTRGDAGCTIAFDITLGVFAGAGLKNVASVEARGDGSLGTTINYETQRAQNPAVKTDAAIKLSLNLSFLCYSKSVDIFSRSWNLYNNGVKTSDAGYLDAALNDGGTWIDLLGVADAAKTAMAVVDADGAVTQDISGDHLAAAGADLSAALQDNSGDTLTAGPTDMAADPHVKMLYAETFTSKQIAVYLGTQKDASGKIVSVVPYYAAVSSDGKLSGARPIVSEKRGECTIDTDYDAVTAGDMLYIAALTRKAGDAKTDDEVKAMAKTTELWLYAYNMRTEKLTKLQCLSDGTTAKPGSRAVLSLPSVAVSLKNSSVLNCSWKEEVDTTSYIGSGEMDLTTGAYKRNTPQAERNGQILEIAAVGTAKGEHYTYYIVDTGKTRVVGVDVVGGGRHYPATGSSCSSLQFVKLSGENAIITYFNEDKAYYIEGAAYYYIGTPKAFKGTDGKDFAFTADQFQYLVQGATTKLFAMQYDAKANTTTLFSWILDGQGCLHGPRSVVLKGKHYTFFSALMNGAGSAKALLADTNFSGSSYSYEDGTSVGAYASNLDFYGESDKRSAAVIGYAAATRYVRVGGTMQAYITLQNDCAHLINKARVALYDAADQSHPLSTADLTGLKLYPGETYEGKVDLKLPSSWKSGVHKFVVKVVDGSVSGVNPASDGEVSMMVEHTEASDLGDEFATGRFATVEVQAPAAATLKVYGVSDNEDGATTEEKEVASFALACDGVTPAVQRLDLTELGLVAVTGGLPDPRYARVRYEVTSGGTTVTSTHYLYSFLYGTQTEYTQAGSTATNDATQVYTRDGIHYGVTAASFEGAVLGADGSLTTQLMTTLALHSDAPAQKDESDPFGLNTIGTPATVTIDGKEYAIELNENVPTAISVVGTPAAFTLDPDDTLGTGLLDNVAIHAESLGTVTAGDPGVSALYGYGDLALKVEEINLGGQEAFRITVTNASEATAGATLKVYRVDADGNETEAGSVPITADGEIFSSGSKVLTYALADLVPDGTDYTALRFEIVPTTCRPAGTDTEVPTDVTVANNTYTYDNPNKAWVMLTYDGEGRVEGAGCYAMGTDGLTVKAIPADGEQFVEWLDANGDRVSTDAEYSLGTLGGDLLLNAVFTGAPVPEPTPQPDPDPTPTATPAPDSNTAVIHAWVTAGGAISPSGYTTVTKGDSMTFTIAPTAGYKIVKVLVDGVDVGAVSSYTLTNIQRDTEVGAYFDKADTATVGNTSRIPATGDSAPYLLWIVLLCAAGAGMGVVGVRYYRKKK